MWGTGPGAVASRGAVVRGLRARAFTADGGIFLGSGLCSRGCCCILSTDLFSAKCRSCPGNRRRCFPPAIPPRKCLQIPSPLSLCVSARSCWHYLFILLHSVTVSTGGGDSPLLIRAGPRLLLVGHFFRGGDGVGLALLKLGAAALGAAAHEASTEKAAGCPACGGRH